MKEDHDMFWCLEHRIYIYHHILVGPVSSAARKSCKFFKNECYCSCIFFSYVSKNIFYMLFFHFFFNHIFSLSPIFASEILACFGLLTATSASKFLQNTFFAKMIQSPCIHQNFVRLSGLAKSQFAFSEKIIYFPIFLQIMA